MRGWDAWQQSQTISNGDVILMRTQCRSRFVATRTPPPRKLLSLSFRNMSKSGRHGNISVSSINELSHVSVSSTIFDDEEFIKSHSLSRFGMTLRMLVNKNDKDWWEGRDSPGLFVGCYGLFSTTVFEA